MECIRCKFAKIFPDLCDICINFISEELYNDLKKDWKNLEITMPDFDFKLLGG